MLKPALRILIAAALCVVVLIAMVVREGAARSGGQEVLLAMQAVDPRSLLSGHYVIIDLRERLDVGEDCPAIAENAQWLALAPNGAHHSLAGGAATRAEAGAAGPIVVRGRYECSPPTPGSESHDGFPGWLALDLGISRFYANQSEAQRIERVLFDQTANEAPRAFAILSIGADGRARIKGLMVDGQRIELGWR